MKGVFTCDFKNCNSGLSVAMGLSEHKWQSVSGMSSLVSHGPMFATNFLVFPSIYCKEIMIESNRCETSLVASMVQHVERKVISLQIHNL
jgi:hypothetical protein